MFARTPRLLLRPGWPEDAAALTKAIADEAIVRNLASAPWPYGEGDARAFLDSWSAAPLPRFLMVQRTAAAPRIIGCIGIDRDADGKVELGYWIARAYWGLGYATEGGQHMIDLARTLGIAELTAGHFIDNPASGAVLRKLGFRATGRIAMRESKARGTQVPTIEFTRNIEAPGNDAGDDGVDAMGAVDRPPKADREEWRQFAA